MHRSWSALVLCLVCSCTRSSEGDPRYVAMGPTDFQLVRSGIHFAGTNFFALAAQEGFYPQKNPFGDNQLIPSTKAAGRIWSGTNGAGLVAFDPTSETYSIYNLPKGFFSGYHTRIAYGDDEFLFVTLGDFATQGAYGPALLLVTPRDGNVFRLIRVPSAGGVFGTSESPEVRAALLKTGSFPQIGWDYRALRNQPVVDLTRDWSLQNPHSIKREQDTFVFSYFESWNVEAAVVRLRVPVAGLRAEVNRLAAGAQMRQTLPK